MDSLIVEDLGKRYFVPSKKAAAAPRKTLNLGFARMPLPRISLPGRIAQGRDLWALRHVTFSVAPGSILGVIGANGAGKSTLLKVIARVTRPTEGRVSGVGRVVSLLELGAGFNPDFSAHDNILMNAAMHGIPRREVLDRMNDIVQFAAVEDFLDNPLKHYSSGMYLRLAFSVAINMQPDILLADEILAVGDMAFQERCLQKVHELARDTGLTVLFVSHDMEAVSRICDRVIWLKGGEVHRDGQAEEVVTEYQNAAWETLADEAPGYKGTSHAARYGEIVDVKLLSADGRDIGSPPRSEDVFVRIRFRTRRAKARARCAIDVMTKGVLVFRSAQPTLEPVAADTVYEAFVKIPANLLSETNYTVNVSILLVRGEGDEHALVVNKALTFMVYGDEHAVEASETRQRKGVINPTLEWSMDGEPNAVGA